MSSGVVVTAESSAPGEIPSATSERDLTKQGGSIEGWLDKQLNTLVFAVIAAAFVIRVIVAARSYLNPDEVLHYIILNQTSVFRAYQVSLTNAHPPLIYLLVYYWRFLGRSELMLRFPSLLAGTGLCWVAYKWIGMLFGRAASVIGLMLVAFSPAMIALSCELRSYALLLFCEATALYFLEIAFKEKSVREMWFFSLFLYLAMLSHYSALFFVLAVGIYALAQILESKASRQIVLAWGCGQAGAIAILGFLYVTHISKLKHYIAIWAVSFDQAYSQSDHQNLVKYTRDRTMDIFSFMFENQYVAQILLLLWIVAITILLVRVFTLRRDPSSPRYSGLLLFLPWIAVWGAAVGGFYPYVGSRHTVFLAPFLIAALSFLLAKACRQKVWAALMIAALLAAASNASGKTFEPYITKENQSRTLMTAAMNHIRQTIPPGNVMLADYQSALMLVHYLCGPKLILPVGTFNLPASRVKCNGYTIASFQAWGMQPSFFLSNFKQLVEAQRLRSGDRVWVFEAGWGITLARQLPESSPKFSCLAPKTFGENISVIPFLIDQNMSPAPVESNCPAPPETSHNKS